MLYNIHRPEIRTGDLLEWRSNSLIGKMIRLKTGKDVNHTSMVIRFMSFDQERVYTLEAIAKGVYPNLVSKKLNSFKGSAYWLPLKKQFDAYRPVLARNGMKYVGTAYDYRSFFACLLAKVDAEANRFLCSEYCYQVLLESGLPFNRFWHVWFISPYPFPGEFEEIGIYEPRVQIL